MAFAREKHAHVSLGLDLSERVADALEDFVPVHGNLLSMLVVGCAEPNPAMPVGCVVKK